MVATVTYNIFQQMKRVLKAVNCRTYHLGHLYVLQLKRLSDIHAVQRL